MELKAKVEKQYRGRFAPTPSGPLHLGSLLMALASFLQAKSQAGLWLLRIDDLDTPRNVPGADQKILAQLEAHGLQWDEPPRYQSDHIAEYLSALDQLQRQGLIYACSCTRAQLRQTSLQGPDDTVYAGDCRHQSAVDQPQALRLKTDQQTLCFKDRALGRQCRDLASEVGDFVVLRTDGLPSYQLACAVDEADQHITEVVRGTDLLGSTFRQLYVQQKLGLTQADYLHLPVLTDGRGRKLSKQNHATAISSKHASQNLLHCLELLGQQPSSELVQESPSNLLRWAIKHWRLPAIPTGKLLRLE